MITLIRGGLYTLIETKSHTKILTLDGTTYAWVEPIDIGEILVTSHAHHTTDCVLATGQYRLYSVTKEAHLADMMHLELHAGPGVWQGYLLLTGLPTDERKRVRIVPTKEVITHNPRHSVFRGRAFTH